MNFNVKNKTIPVGRTFLIDKKKYKVHLMTEDKSCEVCCFFCKSTIAACRAPLELLCTTEDRADGQAVYFEYVNKNNIIY